jgi:hypothetical protein
LLIVVPQNAVASIQHSFQQVVDIGAALAGSVKVARYPEVSR